MEMKRKGTRKRGEVNHTSISADNLASSFLLIILAFNFEKPPAFVILDEKERIISNHPKEKEKEKYH